MSKKNKNKAPKAKKPVTPFDPAFKKGICLVVVFILVFASGSFFGSITNTKIIEGNADATAAPVTEAPTTVAPTTAPVITEAPTVAPATTAPSSSEAASEADTTAAPAPSDGAPQTKAEIVEYFNEAANKIKTDATKVVRNYEDLQHNEEYLEAPGALASIGKGLISSFLKKDETPLEFSKDDIINTFPIKGQNYASTAKESDIAEATCTDEGDSYRIKLKFIEATDPTDTGAATAFNIIDPQDVYSNASVVKSFTCKYYDPVIECTVDKANKRVTWINYTLPIIMNVNAQVVVSLDAQVGMTFIDDYTVTY